MALYAPSDPPLFSEALALEPCGATEDFDHWLLTTWSLIIRRVIRDEHVPKNMYHELLPQLAGLFTKHKWLHRSSPINVLVTIYNVLHRHLAVWYHHFPSVKAQYRVLMAALWTTSKCVHWFQVYHELPRTMPPRIWASVQTTATQLWHVLAPLPCPDDIVEYMQRQWRPLNAIERTSFLLARMPWPMQPQDGAWPASMADLVGTVQRDMLQEEKEAQHQQQLVDPVRAYVETLQHLWRTFPVRRMRVEVLNTLLVAIWVAMARKGVAPEARTRWTMATVVGWEHRGHDIDMDWLQQLILLW